MSEAFIATVIEQKDALTWRVAPRIIEHDGTDHPIIDATAIVGLSPVPGDAVLVLTMKNNLDAEKIERYFTPTESNAVIIGTYNEPTVNFTGEFKIDGDLQITGKLEVTGRVICGALTVNGVPYENHQHVAGTLIDSLSGPVTGTTGAPL